MVNRGGLFSDQNKMKAKSTPFFLKMIFGAGILFLFSNCSEFHSSNFYSSRSLSSQGAFFDENQKALTGLQDQTLRRLFDGAACDDFKSRIWSHIYLTLFDQSPPPPPHIVQKKIKTYIQNYLAEKGGTPRVIRDFAGRFSAIYSHTFEFFADKPESLISEQLAQIDLAGDLDEEEPFTSSAEVASFLREADVFFADLEILTASLGLECRSASPENVIIRRNRPPAPFLDSLKAKTHPLVFGARKVMAAAYQSCSVLDLPLLSPRSSKVQGIVETSHHRGGGMHRAISSLSSLNQTHYYLRNSSSTPSSACFDVSKNPLIYDFGGKPFVSSYPYSQINLFKNSGSGSKNLGIDCSGFVLSSLAAAGLRVRKNKPMKASYISGISSWMLANPSHSLNCFEKVNIKSTPALQAGDIISVNGHTVIVDTALPDPMGISSIRSASGCQKKNISPDKFRFSIIHSSSSFNGIGINRMRAGSIQNTKLRSALIQLASNLCYKKFNFSTPKRIKGMTISRHSIEEPKCVEEEMYIKGEECLSSCEIKDIQQYRL